MACLALEVVEVRREAHSQRSPASSPPPTPNSPATQCPPPCSPGRPGYASAAHCGCTSWQDEEQVLKESQEAGEVWRPACPQTWAVLSQGLHPGGKRELKNCQE